MKKSHEEITEFVKKNALQLTVQLVGIFVLGINTWFATKLVPLTERVLTLENKIQAIDNKHISIEENMITKNDLNFVITRIDKISTRLDGLINLLIKPQYVPK